MMGAKFGLKGTLLLNRPRRSFSLSQLLPVTYARSGEVTSQVVHRMHPKLRSKSEARAFSFPKMTSTTGY